jgi:dTMP kinase
MKKRKGIFIVFEGPEGSGKTTQIKLLSKYFKKKKYDFILTREPGGTKVAEAVRKIILAVENIISPLTELLLYESSRAQHVAEIIKPNLEKGKIVVSDRFADASIAYQGYGRGIDINLVEKLNNIATCGIKPDLVILLDISVEKGLARVHNNRKKVDRLEQEKIAFHKKIRAGYLQLAKKRKDIVVINVENKEKDVVYKEILSILRKKFGL